MAYESSGGDYYIANNPGYFHWRSGGESHINDPMAIADLQVGTLPHSDLVEWGDVG